MRFDIDMIQNKTKQDKTNKKQDSDIDGKEAKRERRNKQHLRFDNLWK